MKSRREYLDYLKDIQDALVKIENFTLGLSFESFAKDDYANPKVTHLRRL